MNSEDAEMAELRELLTDDAFTWPDGHPCRDCGRLLRDHLPRDPDCEGWR